MEEMTGFARMIVSCQNRDAWQSSIQNGFFI